MEKISDDVVAETCMAITGLLMTKTRTLEGGIMILGVVIMTMLKRLPPSSRAEVTQALLNSLQQRA
jgi:hypothetical protein